MIFIDRSIPRAVAVELRRISDDTVIFLDERFPPDTPDREWLAVAGREGWLVISRDKRIRRRPGEREAIRANGVGCFILGWRKNLTRHEYVEVLAGSLAEMQARFAETPRPFIYVLNARGAMRQVL